MIDLGNYKQIGKGHPGESPQEGRPGETKKVSLRALMSVLRPRQELSQPSEKNEEEAHASRQHKWCVLSLGGRGGSAHHRGCD